MCVGGVSLKCVVEFKVKDVKIYIEKIEVKCGDNDFISLWFNFYVKEFIYFVVK